MFGTHLLKVEMLGYSWDVFTAVLPEKVLAYSVIVDFISVSGLQLNNSAIAAGMKCFLMNTEINTEIHSIKEK